MVATVAIKARNGQGMPIIAQPMAWFAPQPLWRAIPREELSARRGQPVLLRFASDRFMDELAALLSSAAPEALARYVAQPETWRDPQVGWDANGRDLEGNFKLYQPAHNRYYLVAGALACRRPGVPDRTIDRTAGEAAFFVLRRLHNGVEYGWATGQAVVASALGLAPGEATAVPGHPGYQRSTQKGWLPLVDPAHMRLCDEEQFPLFPINFQQGGVTRRLLAGLVPTGSRETYAADPVLSPLPSGSDYNLPGGDPRPTLFSQQVAEPLLSLWAWYDALRRGAGIGTTDQRQINRTSAYLLLDLMGLLHDHVSSIYNRIMTGAGNIPAGAQNFWNLIRYTEASGKSLTTVLKAIESSRATLEALEADEELEAAWVFPMVGTDLDLADWMEMPGTATRAAAAAYTKAQVYFEAALSQPYRPPTLGQGPLTEEPEVPKLDAQGADQYIIRLVYDRPQCPFPILSEPSRPFNLAPFFDPDAPARPIRVALPVDTSPEGLRKFPKGVSFQLSNQLRAQMARVVDMKKLMDGEVGEEPSLDLGMICSFSIPIITICALILLMIIVQLLNIIFWWLPFFKICLPLKLSR